MKTFFKFAKVGGFKKCPLAIALGHIRFLLAIGSRFVETLCFSDHIP